jgi:phosphoribosylaminoimidazolecarboxamide formyltransferase/IMP cyclohydrolase
MSSVLQIERALLSVSDKRGCVDLAKALAANNVHILSTGGTAKALRDAGLAVTDVSEFTGFPEIEDGRVKTLNPKVHGALLADWRDNANHDKDLRSMGVEKGGIDLVVVNLYPFKETVAKGHEFDMCIENIDIGGPSMIRSAAKNHKSVTILTSPDQYEGFLAEYSKLNGATSFEFRRQLAAEAFAHTAAYDAAIDEYFQTQLK